MQAQTSFADHAGQAGGFSREDTPAKGTEAVVTAARVVVATSMAEFLDPLALNQFLEIVVESPRAQLVFSLRLAGYLLHDGVTVEILAREGQEDVQRRGRQGQETGEIFLHRSDIGISESELIVKRTP